MFSHCIVCASTFNRQNLSVLCFFLIYLFIILHIMENKQHEEQNMQQMGCTCQITYRDFPENVPFI